MNDDDDDGGQSNAEYKTAKKKLLQNWKIKLKKKRKIQIINLIL